jgi:Pentapeptide repeats (8 copies)
VANEPPSTPEGAGHTGDAETAPHPADRSAEKLSFELAKLRLEIRSLRRQLTWYGTLMEWLKASAVPVTLLGAVLAFYVGFGQLKQSEQNRVSERFDKALERLASKDPIERITGVSGMRSFIKGDDRALQGYGLQSLIDAMAYETDGRVENTILELFSGLQKGQFAPAVYDDALQHAIEHNRTLTRSIVQNSASQIELNQKKRIANAEQVSSSGKKNADAVNEIPSPIPVELISKLKIQDYLLFLDEYHSPFTRLRDTEEVPLQGLRKVISVLIGLGAKVHDFSGIYCERCDFTPATDLSGAKFDGAFLRDSDFSRLGLQKASFRNADLTGTRFYSSDLRSADLSSTASYPATFGYGRKPPFPLLECAKLQGADLTALALLFVEKDYSTTWSGERALEFWSPRVAAAQIDATTKLSTFSVVVSTSITDGFLKAHPDNAAAKGFFNDRERFEGDKLFGTGWSNYPISRHHGDFATNAEAYTETIFSQRKDIEEDSLKDFSENEVTVLQTFLDQPALRNIPLIAKIFTLKGAKSAAQEKVRTEWLSVEAETCEATGGSSKGDLVLDTGGRSLENFKGFDALLKSPMWD